MREWGMSPKEPGETWGHFLEFGLTLDQDEDTLLHVFPDKPKLSHVALKLHGEGEGQWLACFSKTTVRVAWMGGMPAMILPSTPSFAADRARGARANLKAAISVVNEGEKIVHYPTQDES